MIRDIVTNPSSELESGRHVDPISQVYLFLGRCFSFPTEEFYEAVRGAEVANELSALIAGLPLEIDFKGLPSPSLGLDEFESEYINTFDITPTCPLYESAYPREDMSGRDIYEDILRFFEHFDIKLAERERDYHDHLVAELEFMAFLSDKEADARKWGKDPGPYRRAQLDFLEKHLAQWIDKLDERIQKVTRESFYKGASSFLKEFIKNHLLYLRQEGKEDK